MDHSGSWGRSCFLILHCFLSFLLSNSSAAPVPVFSGIDNGPASIVPFATYDHTNSPFSLAETDNSVCFLHNFLDPFSKIFPIKGIMPFKPGI